jgi:hypothetical protein
VFVRHRLTAVAVLVVLGLAGCGSSSSSSPDNKARPAPATQASAAAAPAAPAPECRRVPRRTVQLIASHSGRKTQFAATAAAAIHLPSGYAVSVPTVVGGSRHMATWYVDRLRGPQTVMSGNVEALQLTNWPLNALDSEPVRQSQLCATERMRGPGPLAP